VSKPHLITRPPVPPPPPNARCNVPSVDKWAESNKIDTVEFSIDNWDSPEQARMEKLSKILILIIIGAGLILVALAVMILKG
jgi:hypothetical protein